MSEKNNKEKLRIPSFELGNKIFIDVFVSLVVLLLRIKNLVRIIHVCSTHIYVIKTQYFLKNASPNHHFLFQDLHYVTESFCHFHKLEKHEDQTVTIMHSLQMYSSHDEMEHTTEMSRVGKGSGTEHFS